jgi:integrase
MAVVALTARYVETIKAPDGCLEIRDAKVRGLELRVFPSGAKTWAIRYRRKPDGRKRTHTLGSFPALTLEEARNAAEDARRIVARGGDPADAERAQREAERARLDAQTFGGLAVDWVWRHGRPNKARKTLRGDIQMLRRHVLPVLGDLKATDVTKRDVITMLDAVRAKPDGRVVAKRKRAVRRMTHQPNRVFELVRSIFRWAVGRDLLQVDPTLGLSPPIKKEKPRERELSPDEIRALWLALDRAPAVRQHWKRQPDDFPMRKATAIAIKLALVTAQRIGEVTGLPLAEIDISAAMWKLPSERSKNGQAHRVPLSPLALQLIGEAKALSGDGLWLFPGADGDGPIEASAPTRALERALPKIGVAHFRVHDLRRTAATRMEESGVPPHVVAQVLNHVSVSKGTITKKVYSLYTYDREKREALDKWAAQLNRIVAAPEH